MPEPITIGSLIAAHQAYHQAHPHICNFLHKSAGLAGRGINTMYKEWSKPKQQYTIPNYKPTNFSNSQRIFKEKGF
jgi:hypothetical protein